MKLLLLFTLSGLCFAPGIALTVHHESTVDSLGACQGSLTSGADSFCRATGKWA